MNAIDVESIPAQEPAVPAEMAEPRSLQPLALVTLVLGLLSALALIRTMFWVIPLVAVILGAVSLRVLAKAPELSGRRVALLGMVLALLFGSWASTRYYTRQQWLCSQARAYADAWMDLLEQKKFREAHQLHGRGSQRPPEDVSLEEFYRHDQQAQTNFNIFYGVGPLEAIYQSLGPVQGEFMGVELHERHLRTDQVVLRYHVTYDVNRQPRELTMQVIMRRQHNPGTSDYSWYVEGTR